MSENLNKIDHIVVLMMENRSFDNMLGYLKLEGKDDVDGLTGNEGNEYEGKKHLVHHTSATAFEYDPGHHPHNVARQLSNNCGGFVEDFAKMEEQEPPEDVGLVLGYYKANEVPIYNLLAHEFCVCDRWFCSVPGPTWPNRLYSLAGNSDGYQDNPPLGIRKFRFRFKMIKIKALPFRIPIPKISLKISLPGFKMKTIFEYLDDAGVEWKSYSDDFDFLRIFKKFRFKASRLDGMGIFYWDVMNGNLPAVSWINPNFADIGHKGNDDHPPADVLNGQKLVGRIYNALLKGGKDLWKKTLFIVTYDEHGGFYDHVLPPEAPDDLPGFRKYGCRVPALVVSPWVKKGVVSHTVFDHTSILRTILLRFCRRADGSVPGMGARVDNANDLGGLLTEESPRADATPPTKVAQPKKLADMPKRFQEKAQRPTELQDYVRTVKNEVQVLRNDKLVEPGEAQTGIPEDI